MNNQPSIVSYCILNAGALSYLKKALSLSNIIKTAINLWKKFKRVRFSLRAGLSTGIIGAGFVAVLRVLQRFGYVNVDFDKESIQNTQKLEDAVDAEEADESPKKKPKSKPKSVSKEVGAKGKKVINRELGLAMAENYWFLCLKAKVFDKFKEGYVIQSNDVETIIANMVGSKVFGEGVKNNVSNLFHKTPDFNYDGTEKDGHFYLLIQTNGHPHHYNMWFQNYNIKSKKDQVGYMKKGFIKDNRTFKVLHKSKLVDSKYATENYFGSGGPKWNIKPVSDSVWKS
jgi:hypothetical protein